MVKHNNQVPNAHFHKDWQRYVRTWFDQPAKKQSRRVARLIKAKKVAPRPLNLLRPHVRGQTVKYNRKLRVGRGFTISELREAKINPLEARGIGICVDKRRKNKSQESFVHNVNLLKNYKNKLVLFPRNPTSKRVKKGDSNKNERKTVKQNTESNPTASLPRTKLHIKPRKITKDETETSVRTVLRKALTDAKLWGQRTRRAQKKAEEAAGKKGKAADDEPMAE